MADQRRAGLIQIQVDGIVYDAKGAFEWNPGRPKRETIIGSDRVHGFKETPTGSHFRKITDRGNLDVAALVNQTGVTVTLTEGNGKVVCLRDGWFVGDGTVSTEEGEIDVAWEGPNIEEVS